MAEFKSSNLIERMKQYGGLTDNAWDFIDACTDDWFVEEYQFSDNEPIEYEIRYTLDGEFRSKNVKVIHTHYGDFDAMCAVVEYLAYVNELLIKDSGMGADFA